MSIGDDVYGGLQADAQAAPSRGQLLDDVAGLSVCFTGTLRCVVSGTCADRRAAESVARSAGMVVKTGVSKKSAIVCALSRADCTWQPYWHLVVPDFLPLELYARLRADFPALEERAERIYGAKSRLSSRTRPDLFAEFRATRPLWEYLFSVLEGQRFMCEVRRLALPALVRARGPCGRAAWMSGTGVTRDRGRVAGRREVSVDFEFSWLERGSEVPPHTDNVGKLVSFVLYFPSRDWDVPGQGDTVLYRPRRRALKHNFTNSLVKSAVLEPVRTVPYVSNKLLVFVKSARSYHGVPLLKCRESLVRESLGWNVWTTSHRGLWRIARWARGGQALFESGLRRLSPQLYLCKKDP